MDLALYDPELGYYARAAQRSGRAGDFFTSVDVGAALRRAARNPARRDGGFRTMPRSRGPRRPEPLFDLVEAGAGNGRLVGRHPARGATARSRLLQSHPAASRRGERRGARRTAATLGDVGDRLSSSSAGAADRRSRASLLANELLDALPVHQVVMRDRRPARGLRRSVPDGAGRATAARDARRTAVDAGARRLSRAVWTFARTGLARRDQSARRRLDPRRRATPAARIRRS